MKKIEPLLKCEYCELEFKGNCGVKIHQHYCLTKTFTEMEKEYIDEERHDEFRSNTYFIPMFKNPESFFKWMEVGEIGMLKNKRYILK